MKHNTTRSALTQRNLCTPIFCLTDINDILNTKSLPHDLIASRSPTNSTTFFFQIISCDFSPEFDSSCSLFYEVDYLSIFLLSSTVSVLHCALAVVQCIVIDPVYGFV